RQPRMARLLLPDGVQHVFWQRRLDFSRIHRPRAQVSRRTKCFRLACPCLLYAAGFGAAALALAAASALALRSLRGSARSGLLRAGRLRAPAASRKRAMRSDGVA